MSIAYRYIIKFQNPKIEASHKSLQKSEGLRVLLQPGGWIVVNIRCNFYLRSLHLRMDGGVDLCLSLFVWEGGWVVIPVGRLQSHGA